MRFFDFLFGAVRYLIRACEWCLGRRHYPWSSSPPQRLFALIANRVSGLPGAHYRAVYTVACALLKFRERLHQRRVNFNARIAAPLDAQALRNIVLWHKELLATPPAVERVHVNLRVDQSDPVQLDRVVSVLLMSEALGSISVFYDDSAALAARTSTLTVAEEKAGGLDAGPSLNTKGSVEAVDFEGSEWRRIFSARMGFDTAVNDYLKLAHADSFVVALCLQEDDGGGYDRSLAEWSSALQAFEPPIKNLSVVVLNAVGATLPSVPVAWRQGVAFASAGGLSFGQAIRLAQLADAFVGPMDVFGLAARAARRPGVYMTAGVQMAPGDSSSSIVEVGNIPASEVCARLCEVLVRERKSTHG